MGAHQGHLAGAETHWEVPSVGAAWVRSGAEEEGNMRDPVFLKTGKGLEQQFRN